MAISPLMTLTQGEAPNAQVPNTPATSPWAQLGGYVNTMANDPARMAVLMAGLGLLSGNDVAQSAGTGFGIYNQIAQNHAADAERKRQSEIDDKKLELDTRKVDQGDERITVSREEIASREKVAKMQADARKAAKGKAPRKGIDSAIWKQAFDTVSAATPIDQEIDTGRVYELYNTLSGDTPVYPLFGRNELTAVLDKAMQDPDMFDAYLDATVRSWGPRAGARLQSVWDNLQDPPKEEEPTTPPPPPPTTPVAPPKEATPTYQGLGGIYSKSPLLWLNRMR